jgi:hypothetical protein
MPRAQAAIPGLKVTAETDYVEIRRDSGELITVRFAEDEVGFRLGKRVVVIKEPTPAGKARTGDEIIADLRKIHADMCEFLTENRAANEAQGFEKVGPAAKAVEREVNDLLSAFQQVVYPEKVEVVNWDRGMLGH